MSVQEKANVEVRICLDPRPLNVALKRERTYLPVMDDILPKISKAKVLSKMDLRSGYHHLTLDEQSSNLTCVMTEAGCFFLLGYLLAQRSFKQGCKVPYMD